jgi:hypothetical protein
LAKLVTGDSLLRGNNVWDSIECGRRCILLDMDDFVRVRVAANRVNIVLTEVTEEDRLVGDDLNEAVALTPDANGRRRYVA